MYVKSACLPLKITATTTILLLLLLLQAYEPAVLDQSPDPYRTGSSPKPTKRASIKGFHRNLQEIQLYTVTAQPSLSWAISVLAWYGNFPIPDIHHPSLLPTALKLGNAETSVTELAGTSKRKGNRSNEVTYKTEEKRMAESTKAQ